MNQETKKKSRYEKPSIQSKKVQFITNTFSTPAVVVIEYGPYREPPKRNG